MPNPKYDDEGLEKRGALSREIDGGRSVMSSGTDDGRDDGVGVVEELLAIGGAVVLDDECAKESGVVGSVVCG